MNTEEKNKLIAEFMGLEIVNADIILYELNGIAYPINKLHYHKSWDWLMPVVEKIESFQDGDDGDSMRGHLYNFRIEQNFVYILDGESMGIFGRDVIIEMNGDNKLDATYNAVVEFINQYNN